MAVEAVGGAFPTGTVVAADEAGEEAAAMPRSATASRDCARACSAVGLLPNEAGAPPASGEYEARRLN